MAVCLFTAACAPQSTLDVVIRGGTVYNGSGEPGRVIDIGISGDRIVELGDLGRRPAREVVEAGGLAVAPGFIDADAVSGIALAADGDARDLVRQGVTTAILTKDSAAYTATDRERNRLKLAGRTLDWSGLGQFEARLTHYGTAVNVATFVPAGATTPGRLRAELDAGAVGVLVTDLVGPGSDPQRAAAAARAVAGTQRVLAVGVTSPDTAPADLIDAATAIARPAGLDQLLVILNGREVTTEDAEAIVQRLRPSAESGLPIMLAVNPSMEPARRLFESSTTFVGTGTDTSRTSTPGDASVLAFPTLLAIVRQGDRSLPTAIYQVSAAPAHRFGLANRGEIRPQFYADLVVFDPARIGQVSLDAGAPEAAISYVMVNGVFTLKPSGPTGSRPGRPLHPRP